MTRVNVNGRRYSSPITRKRHETNRFFPKRWPLQSGRRLATTHAPGRPTLKTKRAEGSEDPSTQGDSTEVLDGTRPLLGSGLRRHMALPARQSLLCDAAQKRFDRHGTEFATFARPNGDRLRLRFSLSDDDDVGELL